MWWSYKRKCISCYRGKQPREFCGPWAVYRTNMWFSIIVVSVQWCVFIYLFQSPALNVRFKQNVGHGDPLCKGLEKPMQRSLTLWPSDDLNMEGKPLQSWGLVESRWHTDTWHFITGTMYFYTVGAGVQVQVVTNHFTHHPCSLCWSSDLLI